jgi:hypothetical protein
MKTFLVTAFILLFITLFVISESYPCTFFYAATKKSVLFGNNKDWISTESYVWFCPPEKGGYGRILFGFEFFPGQKEPSSGVNDQGLVFDLGWTSNKERTGALTGETFKGNIFDKILEECSSVDQVLELLKKYNNLQVQYTYLVIMFGDKHGNSLIVDRGQVRAKTTRFQIVPDDSKAAEPCTQYQIAHSLLSSADEISIDLFKRILASTHVEASRATTAYSTICDLKNGKLYIYYFHNFMEEVVLDINEELTKGYRTLELGSLFPPSVAEKDFRWLKNRELEEKKEKSLAKTKSREAFEHISGTFVNSFDPEDSVVIGFENDKLYITSADKSKVELYPESLTKFFIPLANGDWNLTFAKGESKNSSTLVAEHEFLGMKMRYERIK